MKYTQIKEYYDAPTIQVVEVLCEAGFAASGRDLEDGGGFDL